jgi:hypothetical protein
MPSVVEHVPAVGGDRDFAHRLETDMRVSNDRYSRDLRSIELARRMLVQEARTQTICAWAGLTGDRVRNLARSQGAGALSEAQRHRGPSPSRLPALLSTLRMRNEAAAAVGLCRVLRVLPERPTPNARAVLPGLSRGERLLGAFELFRAVVPQARLTLEQLVLLILTIAEGDSWGIDHCTRCHATILIDRLGVAPRRLCAYCTPTAESGVEEPPSGSAVPDAGPEPAEGCVQRRLFE